MNETNRRLAFIIGLAVLGFLLLGILLVAMAASLEPFLEPAS
jgi:hypothetical protein